MNDLALSGISFMLASEAVLKRVSEWTNDVWQTIDSVVSKNIKSGKTNKHSYEHVVY